MYIQSAKIKNVRSVVDFEIKFENPAGWHVLIGDNGAGKSSILRSLALAMVGSQSSGLRTNWADWLNSKSKTGSIDLNLSRSEDFDISASNTHFDDLRLSVNFFSSEEYSSIPVFSMNSQTEKDLASSGFFSVAYGPYRRFEGGNPDLEKLFESPTLATLAAHLSIFGEDVALTEPIKWLKVLNYRTLEKDKISENTFNNLKRLINSEDFLPHGTALESVGSQGVFFTDGNGTTVAINQMSDGYRSILSLTFELIRQLVRVYGSETVFRNIEKGEMFIDVPGVVLIDEIDAHLHPTWQTRIGNWFLKYFPKLQFIVTTHSPLVCRAAEHGSIWRLAAPGSDEESREITGLDRDRLIHGNILDAYGTEVFGEKVSISEETNEMLNRLAELNVKSMMGEIKEPEFAELENLKAILPTESK